MYKRQVLIMTLFLPLVPKFLFTSLRAGYHDRLPPPRAHSAVTGMPITCSPSRSPDRKFDRVEYSSTQSIRLDLNRSASPVSGDFGVNGIHRRRTAWILINHPTANGIQEVVGSIPIGSTRLRSRPLNGNEACPGVAVGEACLLYTSPSPRDRS